MTKQIPLLVLDTAVQGFLRDIMDPTTSEEATRLHEQLAPLIAALNSYDDHLLHTADELCGRNVETAKVEHKRRMLLHLQGTVR